MAPIHLPSSSRRKQGSAPPKTRKTLGLLLKFAKSFLEARENQGARDALAGAIAPALAAVGDLDAAFDWCGDGRTAGIAIGKVASAASKYLDREAARRFVAQAAQRLATMEPNNETSSGMCELAEAQARLGDVEAAKQSAKAIGAAPAREGHDLTDLQAYALIRVGAIQQKAGDIAGANEILREAFRSLHDHPIMGGRDGRYSQIADAQIANGDVAGAIHSVDAILGKRWESLVSIARAQAAAGDHTAARATFMSALGAADFSIEDPAGANPEITGPPPVGLNFSWLMRQRLAETQAMMGDVTGAVQTIRTIDETWHRSDALQSVVMARATAGDVAGALRLAVDESIAPPEERRRAFQGLGLGLDKRLSLKALEARGRGEQARRAGEAPAEPARPRQRGEQRKIPRWRFLMLRFAASSAPAGSSLVARGGCRPWEWSPRNHFSPAPDGAELNGRGRLPPMESPNGIPQQ